MKKYLKLLRVHHYIKNLLVFAALICSGRLFEKREFIIALCGFMAFCMISSVVYILNDIKDVDRDRKHPEKNKRPIASGAVAIKKAWILATVLLVGGAICNVIVYKRTATILLLLYLALNIAYSFGLKNYPMIDILILVSGFIIRLVYGSVITGIDISGWLYLTVFSLSFFFALGKRRNELKRNASQTRQVLQFYPEPFLDKNMYLCAALTNVFYALWSTAEETVTRYNGRNMVFTVPIVMLITMKYSLDIEGDSDGDPVEVLIHDKFLMLLCVLYVSLMFVLLYL